MRHLKIYSFVALSIFGLFSCNKREIIPAPVAKVELKNHFIGTINSTETELTQNVNGFEGFSDARIIVNPDTMDSAIYQSEFKSNTSLQSIKIYHGSVIFDATSSQRPSLAYFNAFFTANNTPQFSNNGYNGLAIQYHDASGLIWRTKHQNTLPTENAHYIFLEEKTDANGDYVKFKLNFNTVLYREALDPISNVIVEYSLPITNATYTGWYKR